MGTDKICQLLSWDSDFFGFKIARLIPSRISEAIMQEALWWCQREGIECLYFLADSDHFENVRLAEKNRFCLVDIRLTLECDLVNWDGKRTESFPGISVRPSQQGDLPNLRAIARVLYRDSRFYVDSRFPRMKVEDLYVTWIDRSCHGYADKVLVLEKDKEAMGYVTCHVPEASVGRIGLVGLHPALKGAGIGQYLVSSALQQFKDGGMDHIEVVTQGRNRRALRMYQSCGFVTLEVQLWYHKWFST